jgi:hypothetical protein
MIKYVIREENGNFVLYSHAYVSGWGIKKGVPVENFVFTSRDEGETQKIRNRLIAMQEKKS